jgi:hypothetical protein
MSNEPHLFTTVRRPKLPNKSRKNLLSSGESPGGGGHGWSVASFCTNLIHYQSSFDMKYIWNHGRWRPSSRFDWVRRAVEGHPLNLTESAVTLNIWFIPVCTSLVRSTLFRVGLSRILTTWKMVQEGPWWDMHPKNLWLPACYGVLVCTCPILSLLAAECQNIFTSAKLSASKGSTTSSKSCSSTARVSSGLDCVKNLDTSCCHNYWYK